MSWGIETSPGTATGADNPRSPDTRKRYRAKIDTATSIRSEIAKLYRACRTGELSVDHFSKLTNALYVLVRISEASDLQQRLEKLEAAQ